MCGIAGLAGFPARQDLLVRMATSIAHRGPDASGYLVEEDAGLAVRRLSIIDVAGGNQPIFNEDESAAIVLNGEIYNHHELRDALSARGHRFRTHSDVETVLHLWEEKGPACARELHGMFAFAIWDRRRRVLHLCRDRLGKKPLYFHRRPAGGIVFGSEIKAILQLPEVPREPDLGAIDQFLTLQYVPSPITAFRGIERIPPAHWLQWNQGRVSLERYWELDFDHKLAGTEEELKEELLARLAEAVRARLESEVPLGALLSGGLDSSAVVAFAAQASTRPLKTFTIGFGSREFDESAYARIVAERFSTDHHQLVIEDAAPDVIDDIVWHHDQPFGDSSAVPSFHVARLTRPHVTVVLNGDGGDESFAGYDRYRLSRFAGYFRLPTALRLAAQSAARPAARYAGRGARLLADPVRDAFDAYHATLLHLRTREKRWLYGPHMPGLDGEPSPPLAFMRAHPHASLVDSMLDTDVNHYLPDDLLVKMDVATMASSVEARSPFLDHRLMEFAARLPARMKLRGGVSKYLLKRALASVLPPEILARRKMGFGVPLGRWLRGSLREVLVDTILSGRALSRGYFREGAVRQMVAAQMAGDDRYRYTLWDLLMLERWHQLFIDRAPEVRLATAPVSVEAAPE